MAAQLGRWMDVVMDGLIVGQVDVCLCGQICKLMDVWMSRWMDEWMDDLVFLHAIHTHGEICRTLSANKASCVDVKGEILSWRGEGGRVREEGMSLEWFIAFNVYNQHLKCFNLNCPLLSFPLFKQHSKHSYCPNTSTHTFLLTRVLFYSKRLSKCGNAVYSCLTFKLIMYIT